MNTPRSPRAILLARHTAALPALDAQRAALLARFAAADSSSSRPSNVAAFLPFAFFALLHRELVAPCRRSWASLAIVWIALLSFQQLDRLVAPDFAPAPATSADVAVLAVWLEQRRLLATFAGGVSSAELPARETPPPPAGTHPLGAIDLVPVRTAFA